MADRTFDLTECIARATQHAEFRNVYGNRFSSSVMHEFYSRKMRSAYSLSNTKSIAVSKGLSALVTELVPRLAPHRLPETDSVCNGLYLRWSRFLDRSLKWIPFFSTPGFPVVAGTHETRRPHPCQSDKWSDVWSCMDYLRNTQESTRNWSVASTVAPVEKAVGGTENRIGVCSIER